MAYFSNSSEGMLLDDECSTCPAEVNCPIIKAHFLYNYDQVGNEVTRGILNMLVTEKDGKYIGCQMKAFVG